MGVHTIFVRNMSGHSQLFKVHGWNNNQSIMVPAHGENRLQAHDGSSGAIIAVHDGHEGEQAEITKSGYGGNDFFDVSIIVGAGGNMVCQQVGDPKTRKGDPHLMQEATKAWARLDQGRKNEFRGKWVWLGKDGKTVVRIGPPKDNKDLENWLKTFARHLYIGVGAWNGNAGDASDNVNSSASKGSKDILVCYNDGDATPHDRHGFAALSHTPGPHKPYHSPEHHSNNHPEHMSLAAVNSPGIHLTNKSSKAATYYFYNNYWNGSGTAGANFDHPLKHVTVQPGKDTFVSLPASFKGRLQRGTKLPCTWVEFQLEAANDHAAHGDVSLQQGTDSPYTVASTDGSNRSNGLGPEFRDLVARAPEAAVRKKPNGERAIDTTVGNWNGGPNKAAIEYLNQRVTQRRAYIVGGTGVPDVASKNKRLAIVMY